MTGVLKVGDPTAGGPGGGADLHHVVGPFHVGGAATLQRSTIGHPRVHTVTYPSVHDRVRPAAACGIDWEWRDAVIAAAARAGRPATNPRLVERLVAVARAMGREPATPQQVRERLGIPNRP